MDQVFLYLPSAMLIFCRITSFFVIAPVFSFKNVPSSFKIGFSFFVTFITFTVIGTKTPVSFDALYILLIIREIMMGLLLAFVASLFFNAVQIAGSFMDLQIGFGMANILDPMTGASSPLLGNLKSMVATMLFLAFDGHHFFLQAVLDSYQWVPLEGNGVFASMAGQQLTDFLIKSLSSMFAVGFQMAFPVVAAMFLTDLGLGLLTRVAPQFNVFVVGVPLKLLLGLLILMVMIPGYISLFHDLFSSMFASMQQLLQLIARPS